MKTWTRIFLAVAVGWCVGGAVRVPSAHAGNWQVGLEIRAVEDFYEPMSEHGYWVHREAYGWCWYPAQVAADWRPYATGHWQWTDQGWYWASDEPWAWACYHYGRWVWDDYYGWLWIPGIEWAPSWVVWREGGGYIGWAPMSPACQFDGGGYVSFSYASYRPHSYVFVEYGNFCRPIYPAIIIHHTYVHQHVYVKTVNCTKIKRVKNTIVNEGPDMENVERHASRRVEQRPVTEVRKEEETRRERIVPTTPPVAGRVERRDDDGRRNPPSRIVNADNPDRRGRYEEPRRMPVPQTDPAAGETRRDVKPPAKAVEQKVPPTGARRDDAAPGQIKREEPTPRRVPMPESRDRSTTVPAYGKQQVQSKTMPVPDAVKGMPTTDFARGNGHGQGQNPGYAMERQPKGSDSGRGNDQNGKVR
jgi:hypothetical protein